MSILPVHVSSNSEYTTSWSRFSDLNNLYNPSFLTAVKMFVCTYFIVYVIFCRYATVTKDDDCSMDCNDEVQVSLSKDNLKETQSSVDTCDFSCSSSTPNIVIEDIQHSDDDMMFFTGLPNYKTFNALFQSLIDAGGDGLSTENQEKLNRNHLGRKRKLRRVDEFLLVLMRLRLGLLLKDLEFRFKISASAVSKIFNRWISFMYECMQAILFLPDLKQLQMYIPECFKNFSDTRIVLDCTEVFVQTPSSLENRSLTFSNYKSHDTFKALVGISMTGAVTFVSKLWPGSTSDVDITRNSGLFDILQEKDAVMVDKGFVHLRNDFKPRKIKLYCPPFKTKEQFSKSEVEMTRRIASARIHVERKIEQIKNFRILQGVLPLALSDIADEIFFVCSAMTNLLPPLVM